MKQRVYKVHVGSRNDEKLRDRFYHGNRRGTVVCKLPVRKTYLIEARGMGTADRKAIRLAGEDGISNAVVLGTMLMNSGHEAADRMFDDLFDGR